jgi:KDO2-lipid IV(A) lauroyltransferase
LNPKKSWLQVRAEYLLAASLIHILRLLPLRAANALARSITRVLDIAVPKLRRVAQTNLFFAFPQLEPAQRGKIIDGVFRTIARMLVALARLPSINKSSVADWIGYDGLENYLEAKREGRGVLIATAHLGNWELSAYTHAIMTEAMHVMVRPLDNPLVDELVETRRTASGNHLIYKRDAARAVITALRRNEAVGILIDQNTSAAEGVFVDFFGKKANAGSAFVKFAHHAKAPVIPGFALWEEKSGRYVLRFYPRVEMSGDVQADTQRIHSVFEEIIREHPDQWMWIHRRWKTRPAGEPALY